MNRELRVLSALLDSRAAYNRVASAREERDFSEQGWLLIQEIDSYYEKDNGADSIDKDVLKDILIRKYPKASKMLITVLEELKPVSIDNVISDYVELKREALEHAIGEAMLAGDDYSGMLEQLNTIDTLVETEESTLFIDADIDDLLESMTGENLISVSPKVLNDAIDGGFMGGHQFAIYAPTEVGKSMVSISISCGFLRNGYKVLYCGNEDPARSMLIRFYNNLSGMTKDEIKADPAKARRKAVENGYGNLIFKEMQPGSVREVRAMVEKYEPHVVIVDQMANMEAKAQSKVEKNERLASALRSVAKKYNVVMGIVHQASDDAYGKNILEKNHMYYSNVGVQGQMDLMIGIGMDASYEQQDLRMLCLTKNKLGGQHAALPVRVNPALSAIEE